MAYQTDSARAPDSSNDGNNENKITVKVEPIDITAGIGAYVNLSAVVRAQRPTYQWFNRLGDRIPGKTNCNLFIGPIREEDFGFYRLQIVDEILKQTALSRWVELKNSNPPRQYTESIGPTLVNAPKGGEYMRGTTVNLYGHFSNACYYQWYKNGVKLEGCDGNTLTINNSGVHNSGEYVLLAANEVNQYAQVPMNVQIY